MVQALVLRVAGVNCETETAFALSRAGFNAAIAHLNSVANGKVSLQNFDLLVLPGGFSYGDYLGSAKVLANELKIKMKQEIKGFIEEEKLVLGICNGFQALVKCGLLPAFAESFEDQSVTLTFNDSMHFQDQWVTLKKVGGKNCVFAKGIEEFDCPINHGEGKFVPQNSEVLKQLYKNDLVVFKYKNNPNGSIDDIAAICDKTGRVFGLMPHPEKHIFPINHPLSTRKNIPQSALGLKIFQNAFDYFKR